jgi:hypothetical protein
MKLQITIPTSLKEITLDQYQRFMSIVENNPESDFVQQKMLEIFCNVPLNMVDKMPFKDVNEIVTTLNLMLQIETKFQNIFKLGNTNFGFIPNLDEISLGEFSDLDNYLGKWDKMHNAMAILYRPIKEKYKDKYEIEEYNGSITYADVMKYAPMDIVMGAMVFFYNLSNDLLISSMNYLENNPQVQAIINKHNLEQNGDGIVLSMHSLKVMLEDLMKFQKLDLQLP